MFCSALILFRLLPYKDDQGGLFCSCPKTETEDQVYRRANKVANPKRDAHLVFVLLQTRKSSGCSSLLLKVANPKRNAHSGLCSTPDAQARNHRVVVVFFSRSRTQNETRGISSLCSTPDVQIRSRPHHTRKRRNTVYKGINLLQWPLLSKLH